MVTEFVVGANTEGPSPRFRRFAAAVAIAATTATAATLILTPVPANAAVPQTRYVRVTGSDDENDCTDINNPCATVQLAIDEANEGDTVDIGPGTFVGATADKSLNFTGAGVGQTTLQADPASPDDPVLLFESEDVSSYTVMHLTFQGNSAGDGTFGDDGGIFMDGGGDLMVDDVLIKGAGGTGLYAAVAGDVTVENSTLTGNATRSRSAAAIIAGVDDPDFPGPRVSSLALTNDSVSDNGADLTCDECAPVAVGVGVAAFDTAVTVSGSTISGNAAGGIGVLGGTLDISNSTVAADPAGSAEPNYSAVFVGFDRAGDPSTATITDTTISASPSGGAGLVMESPVTDDRSAAAAITGVPSAAVANDPATNSALLAGTIIVAPGESVACDSGGGESGAVVDGGYNISSDDSCGFTAATSKNSTDPLLGPLAANGGPTRTMLPGTGSPAIDAIPATAAACLPVDQRAAARPSPTGGLCDIGSVEVQPAPAPPGEPQPKTTPIVKLTAVPPGGAGAGQAVTLTATVTGSVGAPTGTIDFTEDGTAISAACTAAALTTTDSVTSATCEIPNGITAGTHSFTATYSGDANYTSAADTITYPPTAGGGVKPRIVAHVHSRVPRHHGWYRKSVRISFTCIPGSAPLVPPCPSPAHLGHSGAKQVVSRTIKDTAGESASATVLINIDKRRPAVRIRGLHHHHEFQQPPTLTCMARDDLSGVAFCHLHQHVTSPDHLRIHNNGQSQNKVVHVVAIAKDNAGNVHRRHATYELPT